MKSLLLLRHAKSSWDDSNLDDFDRPLAPRGIAVAPIMGKEMVRRGWLPDFALVSDAARTRETFALLGIAVAHRFDPMVYEAPARRILDAILDVPASIEMLLVIGHNPGLQELSLRLANSHSNDGALTSLSGKFSTAALARFAFKGDWTDLTDHGATLTDFIRPRDLR